MTFPTQPTAGPTAQASPMVFVSHSTGDRPIANWVAAQAEAMGVRCYLAEDNPEPGANLSSKIRIAIEESDAMLALLTEAGDGSKYVQQEIGAAVQAGKPVLALVEQYLGIKPVAMLDGIEYIPFDRADLGTASSGLIAGLRSVSERRGVTPPPTEVSAQPAFQVQFAAELNLSGGQILIGLLAVAAIAGLIYIAVQSVKDAELGGTA